MNELVIASDEADARAAAAVEQHHAQLSGALALKAGGVIAAAVRETDDAPSGGWVDTAATDLVQWCRTELIPHAVAEETTLYAAARERVEGRLLVESMLREHAVLMALVDEIEGATSTVAKAAGARTLQVLFDTHLDKENTLVLPLLVGAPDVSVAKLLEGMHELIGGGDGHAQAASAEATAPVAHDCTCGEEAAAGYPELDARAVPHAIRHATVFGALDGVRANGGLVLVAPHDPKPLLAQLERRNPGEFTVEYLERGPEAWRLAIVRQSA
ncbi:cation-binding protein [Humibacillus sp. DSM 29435]|uniref:DUF2249 domain-containing protein n=1 Tax=Humibacillus sp. DSM 29435 TaxID=1869167 RepID=UPI0008725D46|nr:DUF2249 domain-containing protein [Humibacillus sp. DSM 29435]OFE17049.1 cation-binding protein [Humibacillus sp. DSM 29435]